jgi:hypothetical protein
MVLSHLRHAARRGGYAPPDVADAAELDAWLALQPQYCRVCRKKKRLVIDHCHLTGRLRGLLCNYCNSRVVGLLEKGMHLLEAATRYLSGEEADAKSST